MNRQPWSFGTQGNRSVEDPSKRHPNRLRYDVYLAERANLVEAEFKLGDSFDRGLLTIAGLGFGYSIISGADVGALHWFCALLLVLAWVSLGSAVVHSLRSQFVGQAAYERQREILDVMEEDYAKGKAMPNEFADRQDQLQKRSIRWLIVGIVLFIMCRAATLFMPSSSKEGRSITNITEINHAQEKEREENLQTHDSAGERKEG
jgi:uncharacterized membrane protein